MSDDKLLEPESAVSDDVQRSWIRRLGPGLITGAADDDPSGIGTYSQAGAHFAYNLLWTLLLAYPLMTAIQLVSAHIGRVTGKGLASNMRAHYPRWLLYGAVSLLVLANVINIAADLSAMGAAVGLLVHGPQHVYVVLLGDLSVVLQIFVPYERLCKHSQMVRAVAARVCRSCPCRADQMDRSGPCSQYRTRLRFSSC